MSKQIHKLATPDGDRYKIWSDNSNQYTSDVLTLDQLKLFSKLMNFDQILTDLFYNDGDLENLKFDRWLKDSEVLEKWEEESEHIPASPQQKEIYREMAKKQAEFLLQMSQVWEKFYLECTV